MKKLLLLLLCLSAITMFACSGGGSRNVVIVHEEPTAVPQGHGPANIEASNQHLSQAKVMYVKGKYKQTQDHAEKAIAFNEKNWEAYYYLGLAMQKRRDYQMSLDVFSKGLKYSPDNRYVRSELHFALGYSWEQMGKLDKADGEYGSALDFNPENIDARQGTSRIKIEKTMKGWGKDVKKKTDG